MVISLEASRFQNLDFVFFSCNDVEKWWSHHTLSPDCNKMREKNISGKRRKRYISEKRKRKIFLEKRKNKPPNHPLCGQMDGQKENQDTQHLCICNEVTQINFPKLCDQFSTSMTQAKKLILVDRELLCFLFCLSVSLIPERVLVSLADPKDQLDH